MDRAQSVDKKNGIIRLVKFTSGLMVTKMSTMAHFLHFFLMTVIFC